MPMRGIPSPQRQYGMKSVGNRTQAGPRPGERGETPRPGHSGEGARSALEQLIQQELRRTAQRPREDDRAKPAAPARPLP